MGAFKSLRLVFILTLLFGLLPELYSQQIEIPREGFPFCEPFTSTIEETRADIIFGGQATKLTNFPVGNGALMLTDSLKSRTGYAFIDIPFSAKYGIKVSFEYFSYASTTSVSADGLIFFMFDGKYGGPSSPLPFSPGGEGGSLSYSPRTNPPDPLDPLKDTNNYGMSGGYIAVSLDEYGNFAYSAEGKGTGIDTSPNLLVAPPKPIMTPILHSILVRGPESAGYPYMDDLHKYTNESDICGICVTPGLRFPIDSPKKDRVEQCSEDGYRKVFIDLKPDGTNRYKLTMHMLVNTGTGPRIVEIFKDVDYPYEALFDLKIGFAASTGAATNIHEIKNVVVEVSEISDALLPQTEDKDFQLCVVESGLEIKFPIVLPDEDAFIRCLQLYQIGEPIPSNNNSNSSIPTVNDCGFGNSACDGLCNPINFEKQVTGGTFKADLQPLYDTNIDLIGNEVQIQFVPDPGFVGTAEIIYTVTDNFGLTSDPKKITVQVLPQPVLESEDIVFPTCDLQQDGSIFLIVGELYDNYTFNWVYTSPGGVQTDLGPAGTVLDLGGNRRSFFLDNLNLGTYKLIVDNPSDAIGCPIEVAEIFLDKERGTPVELDLNDQIICEGQDVTFNPLIDGSFGPDSGAEFFWYESPNRVDLPITNGSTRIIGGQVVSFEIINEREIIISNLPSDGINFKDYIFYVEAKPKSNPSGNFCPFLGDVITEARVRVYPKLDFSATKTADDWCLDNSGNIIAEVKDPTSAITYSLVNSDNGAVLMTYNSGNFSGLAKGNYEVFATSSNPVCTSVSVLIVIEGPDQPLTLTPGPTENAFCNAPTGEMQFNLSGGNLPYKSITIDGSPISNPAISGEIYTLSDLSAGTYTIVVTDDKDCQESIQITIAGDEASVFATTNDEICEGESAMVSPQTITQSTSTPIFKWYYLAGGNHIEIINGATAGGATFTIDGSNNLSVSGLAPQGTPYVYFLEVTGPKVCDQGYIPAEIRVNPTPKPSDPILDMVSCNGGSDGSIQIQLSEGNLSDFQYALTGNNGVNIGFTSNSGLFSGLAAGIYELSIRSSSGCETILTGITLSEPPVLSLAITSKTDATCAEENGELSFTVGGGTLDASGTYQIDINGAGISTLGSNVTVGSSNDYTITNLAPGNYLVEIEDTNGCLISRTETILDTEVPVFIVQDIEVCEGETAILTPEVVSNTIGASPVYNWSFENPTSPGQFVPIQNGDVINGVTYSLTNGVLSVSGLVSSNISYKYYLSVSGDLVCPGPPIESEIQVLNIPKAVFQEVNVSCFNGNDGEIQLVSVDPSGSNTFTLIETGQSNSTGSFTGLTAGTYTVRIQETGSPCFSDFQVTITQPEKLELINPSSTDPTCGEANGQITFEIIGGTSDYQIFINGDLISTYAFAQAGQVFEVSDLAPGTYAIEVTDAQGCVVSLPSAFVLMDDQGVQVNLNPIDVEFCFKETVVLVPVFNPALSTSAELKWYKDQASTDQIVSSTNPDPSNVIYQINNSGALSIQNLAVGQYTYYLEISGPGICTKLEEVKVQIFPEIVASFDFEDVSCFGGNDGSIRLTSVVPSGPITYTIVETGVSNTTGIFENLIAGTYTVRAQEDGSPCTYDFPFTLSQPNELIINNPQGTNPTCGESNGSIQFDVTGGSPDYSILVNGNPLTGYTASINGQTVELRNLPPGTYSVAVTDANDCEVTAPNLLTLVNDNGVDVNMNPLDEVICVGGDAVLLPTYSTALPVVPNLKWYKDAALTQSITNGTDAAGVIYQINPTSGELTIQGLQIGDFTYYVEISGSGICSKVESATVEVYPEITATIAVENIICFGDTNGSILITPSGGNGNFETSLNGSPFAVSTSYSNLAAGTYTVSIRNDLSCLTEIDVEVVGPAEAISINTPTIIRASCGLDNGSIGDLVISGGWGGYNVEWRKGSVTGTVVTGGLTGASDLSPDTYFLLITDSEGCDAEFSFVIGQSSDPVYAVVPPINACTGNSVEIRPIHIAPNPSLPPAAATEVRWYSGPNQAGLIQNGPDSSIPGVTYTIDDSDWLNPELRIDGLPAGTYEFYFFVECTGQEIEIEVIVFDTPEVEIETQNISCFGDANGKVRISKGSNSSYTYSVNGAPPVDQSALESRTFSPGTYDLTIATPAGCAQNLKFEIKGPSAPLSSSALTKIDPGCGASNGKLTLTITGGWLPYTLEVFKNGVSATVITSSDPAITLDGYSIGDYEIVIKDAEGCSLTTNSVKMVDGPTQVLVDNEVICEGEIATLLPTLDPVATGATFQWFFDQSLTQPISSSPNPASDGRIYQINSVTGALTISGLSAANTPYPYFVTASASTVCPGFVGRGNVTVASTPSVSVVVIDEACFGDGGTITVSASGGSGNYTYSLNGGNFVNTNVFDVKPGTYEVEVKTAEGCLSTLSSIEVKGPQASLAVKDIEQDNTSCELDNGELRFTLTGGSPPYRVTYSKNGSSAGNVNSADGIIVISGLGLGNYMFFVEDVNGCRVLLPDQIEIIEVSTTITSSDKKICEGESVELVASVPQNITDAQFQWYFDAQGNNPIIPGTINGITYSFTSNGKISITGLASSENPYSYFVSATGTGVCGINPKEVKVTVSRIPILRVSNPSIVCDPLGTVNLTDFIEGFNPNVYNYSVLSPAGAAMQLNDLGKVSVSGDYRVSSSLKGTNCWNAPQRIRVLIADKKLEAMFEYLVDYGGGNIFTNGDIQIMEDVQFQDLTVGKAILYNWDFGDGQTSSEKNPIHKYQEKGTYNVILSTIDEFGCQSEFQLIVNVFDDFLIMVPNAFTPDGVKNQYFKPQFRGIASLEFYIFNTWGELIYHATSLEDRGWDGTLNGRSVPNGNYVYKARFVSRSGETGEKAGVFILIR